MALASWTHNSSADDGSGATSEATVSKKSNRTVSFGVARPLAIPDIYGPGAVLRGGNVHMKISNNGVNGNPTTLSSDPSGQWPGNSGVEYLYEQDLAVGAANPFATDPNAIRRVSLAREWAPPTPAPEDRMYRGYDGIVGGMRLTNDDGDSDPITGNPRVDEDFFDGRDNDGDGRIDEDFAALGQTMYSCVMRDDTPGALANVGSEKHVPLFLECRQLAWCYSIPGLADFNVIEYTIYNRSGHTLDSMFFSFPSDIDAGPASRSGYWSDDQDVPNFPSGAFRIPVDPDDPRYQLAPTPAGNRPLCPVRTVRVNGYSVVDQDGDNGKTPGVASILLFGHTIDPLGLRAPTRVGFRSFRSYVNGTPFISNGAPSIDQHIFQLMSSQQNIGEDGFITQERGDQSGDYGTWPSVGPFRNVPDGGSITATIGFAVHGGDFTDLARYGADYAAYQTGALGLTALMAKYPALQNAMNAQIAYEGVYEPPREGFEDQVPDCHGCETPLRLSTGSTPTYVSELCPDREAEAKLVTDNAYTWFDFDCDRCTGVYDGFSRRGYFQRHWNAESPPPSPNLNVASNYNYSDRPDRVVASQDNQITLAWDNISENTPDPRTGWFDFRSYRIWKVAGWKRPVGAAGPNEEDWALLGEYRLFEYRDSTDALIESNFQDSLVDCPRVFIPSYEFPPNHPRCSEANGTLTRLSNGGCRDTAIVSICLHRGDLWNRQNGQIIRPNTTMDCARDSLGECIQDEGKALGDAYLVRRTRYPVGRYRMVDSEVKNGFLYFYSITAGDSTAGGELFGRRSAVEADAVTPQAAPRTDRGAWVVPNPYRGYGEIAARSSSWDLTPSATDPTGTHIDFMGLPRGRWTIRIYTVSGDLVQEIRSEDPVNESVRVPVRDERGQLRPGFNRQQDNPDDGQARWNLISRNGQDIVSGIYLFVVDSEQGQQRGKFVVIR